MGANQSASRTIPVRPRTPLKFGSAMNTLQVNPGDFNISPRSYASTNRSTDSSVSSLLSQESYFNGLTPASPMTPLGFEDLTYSRTRSISPLSTTSDSPMPHRFTCPKQNCPYMIIGYQTPEELENHMFAVNHFEPGLDTGLDFSAGDYGWFSPQENPELYPQHPLTIQRQRITEQQQKQQQVQQSQQCNCHHCLHQVDYNGSIQFEPRQPSMQIQMPPPPTIIGYHDAGFELVSWRQQESPSDSPAGHQMNQAEYSSLVQSGMYMDFNQVGSAGRSSFM